jgi:hypothetical protein
MYELAEITDLIHGCEGEDDPAPGPTDPESAMGCLLIGELVEELREEDSPIGQLFAACPVELLAELVLRLAALGAVGGQPERPCGQSDQGATSARRFSVRTLSGWGCGIVALAP